MVSSTFRSRQMTALSLELAAVERLCQRNSNLDLSMGIFQLVFDHLGRRSFVLEKVRKDSKVEVPEGSPGWYMFTRGGEVCIAGYSMQKGCACVQIHTTPFSNPTRFTISNTVGHGRYCFAYDSLFDRLFVFSESAFSLYSLNLATGQVSRHGVLDLPSQQPLSSSSVSRYAIDCAKNCIIITALGKAPQDPLAATVMTVYSVRLSGEVTDATMIWSKTVEGFLYPEYAELSVNCDELGELARRTRLVACEGGESGCLEVDIIVRKTDGKLIHESVSPGRAGEFSRWLDISEELKISGAKLSEEASSFGPIVCVQQRGKFIDILRTPWGSPSPKELVLESFIIDLR